MVIPLAFLCHFELLTYDSKTQDERGDDMNDLPEHLTRAEAAAYLRVSLPTLGRRIKGGDLEVVKIGGST